MANYNGPLRPSKLDLIIFFVAVATVFCYKWASAVTNLLCYHRNRIIFATRSVDYDIHSVTYDMEVDCGAGGCFCIVPTLTSVMQTAKYITLNALQC